MKKVHMRRCIACMESKPKNELYRIVRDQQGNVCFDKTGKLSGRGTYICSVDCLKKAIKTRKISKELNVNISDETYLKISEDIEKYVQ